MNVKKSVLILFAVIFVVGTFSSCVTDSSEIGIQLVIRAGDERIFNTNVKLQPTKEDGTCSVIDVINNAIAIYEVDVKLDSTASFISKIKNYGETSIEGIEYYWMYTINGTEPTSGRADSNFVKDGDTVEYLFYYTDPGSNPPATMKTGPYKSEWELFGEGEATTAEEESSEEAAE